MRNLILKNGIVISPDENIESKKDIKIFDGKIVEISDCIEETENFEVKDISGLYVSSGFVEMHSHMRDLGQSAKETLETGLQSAIAGGYTAVCAMPNTNPIVDNPLVFRTLQEKAKECSELEFHQFSAITKGLDGKEIVDFSGMQNAGVIAFSDDGRPVEDMSILKSVFELASELDAPHHHIRQLA